MGRISNRASGFSLCLQEKMARCVVICLFMAAAYYLARMTKDLERNMTRKQLARTSGEEIYGLTSPNRQNHEDVFLMAMLTKR